MRDERIDAIKGIAILFVLLIHSQWIHQISEKILWEPFWVNLAVPIFLLVAGYNAAVHPFRLWPRIKRLLIPALPIVAFQIWLYDLDPFWTAVKGGVGVGSHFIPLFFVTLLLLPPMIYLAKKNMRAMLLAVLLVEIVAETYHGWPYDLYLRLPLRYLFAVALGVWLGMDGKPNRVLLAAGALVGLVTIYTTIYLEINPFHTLALSHIWVLFLVMTGMRLPVVPILPALGRASYHILLVQMLYFGEWSSKIDALIAAPLWLNVVLDIALMSFVGWAYWSIAAHSPSPSKLVARYKRDFYQ